jgi:hypothetical protein
MVSFSSRHETSAPNTNFSQAIFLAYTGDFAYAVDPYRAQPRCTKHHPFRD